MFWSCLYIQGQSSAILVTIFFLRMYLHWYVGALLGFWNSVWCVYPQHCTFPLCASYVHVMFVVLTWFKESQPLFTCFHLVPWHSSRRLSHRPTSLLRSQTQSSIKALAFSTTWVLGKGEVCWRCFFFFHKGKDKQKRLLNRTLLVWTIARLLPLCHWVRYVTQGCWLPFLTILGEMLIIMVFRDQWPIVKTCLDCLFYVLHTLS